MIKEHQPTIFDGSEVLVGVSSIDDGNMRFRVLGKHDDDEVLRNRSDFLESLGIDIAATSLVYVTYDRQSFTEYRVVDSSVAGVGMMRPGTAEPADGLATTEQGLALFLPLADCSGAVLHDTRSGALMVAHWGRHCTIEDGATRAVTFMADAFQTDPEDLDVWLSPGVGIDSYAMEAEPADPSHYNFLEDPLWANHRYLDGDKVHIDITGFNVDRLIAAGVKPDRIEVSGIDTATSPDYPSHSQGALARYAIVAVRRP